MPDPTIGPARRPGAGHEVGSEAANRVRPPQRPPVATGGAGPVVPPSVPSSGWSSLGPTPAAPPVRSNPGGGPQYLPPVAPPVQGRTPEVKAERAAKQGGRWGWRAAFSFLAGGLIAAAGFGAAQLGGTTEAALPPETTVQPTSIPTTTTNLRDDPVDTVPLVPVDVDEPAAFVATSLGPAVVQVETDVGLGSGVIYDDGLILTNNHVVEGASQLRVRLNTGETIDGEVLGTHEQTDIAVISIGPGRGLPVAQLATREKARVGQIAIAIGSPFQLQQSVTAGIVSAVDRPVVNDDRQTVIAMIQTDAPINPGNSGGALADRQGRVIGINTSIQTDGLSSSNSGIGFAIPIDTAIRIADLIVAGEPIVPGFLGVEGSEPAGGEAGVEIITVTPDSAAELAGLQVGDRVLNLDDAPVTGIAELAGLVLARQAGDTVILDVIRDGQAIEIPAVLGARDP